MGGLRRLDDTAVATSVARAAADQPCASFSQSLPEYSACLAEHEIRAARHRQRLAHPRHAVRARRRAGELALLTVSHGMLTSMRNRRRDLAILRSLGADRGWITRAVHWQATLLTALPVVIGVPAGHRRRTARVRGVCRQHGRNERRRDPARGRRHRCGRDRDPGQRDRRRGHPAPPGGDEPALLLQGE